MAWERASVAIMPASIGTGLKISLKKIKGASAKMTVTLTGEAMKDAGWKDGDKIEVMFGTGEHHGLLRMRKNNSVGQAVVSERKAVRGGRYLTIALGVQDAFVDRSEPAAWCKWEKIEDGWFEIVMPKWADETAPRARQANRQPVDTNRSTGSPAPRGKSVTAEIMSDPEPGRREAAEKIGRKEALARVGSIKS